MSNAWWHLFVIKYVKIIIKSRVWISGMLPAHPLRCHVWFSSENYENTQRTFFTVFSIQIQIRWLWIYWKVLFFSFLSIGLVQWSLTRPYISFRKDMKAAQRPDFESERRRWSLSWYLDRGWPGRIGCILVLHTTYHSWQLFRRDSRNVSFLSLSIIEMQNLAAVSAIFWLSTTRVNICRTSSINDRPESLRRICCLISDTCPT